MKKNLNYIVWSERDWHIAQCLDIDIASQGETEEQAVENLKDALKLHFTPPIATVLPQIRQIEFEVAA